MRKDFQIALLLAVASLPAGLAMSIAVDYFPYLKEHPGVGFWFSTGATFLLLSLAALIAIRGEQEAEREGGQRRMIPLIGMIVFGVGFVGCATWYFWPFGQNQNAEQAMSERNLPERAVALAAEAQQITPIIEALKQNQKALAEFKQTTNLLGRVLAQFDSLQSGIATYEKMTDGKKHTEERLAAAEHIIRELGVILRDVRPNSTPQGLGLIIKTAPNTFRVTFPVPMRIPPQIDFLNLPEGAISHITEHSTLGFTVVFSPQNIVVETFGFAASAEL